jgi:hypothetical protein
MPNTQETQVCRAWNEQATPSYQGTRPLPEDHQAEQNKGNLRSKGASFSAQERRLWCCGGSLRSMPQAGSVPRTLDTLQKGAGGPPCQSTPAKTKFINGGL